MDVDDLADTELPSGRFAVEEWKAFLWADATRDDEAAFRYDEAAAAVGEDGQLVPHTMAQHIAFEATGGIEATMGRLSDDWRSGAALGQLQVEFHAPLETGQPLVVTGRVTDVEEKDGSSGGLTVVSLSYDVETPAGDPVFDMVADMVLMEET